ETVEALHRRCGYAVFRRCRQLLGDEAEARDMTQEVFLYLVEQPRAFQERSSISTYVYSVATQLCLRRLRDRSARQGPWEQAVSATFDGRAPPSLETSLQSRQILEALFGEADETTASIAVYHFVDGLTQAEIGKLVGLSRVTVNQRLARFRE